MEAQELQRVLEAHSKWREGNGEGAQADLHGADLQYADLQHANLHGADLRGADLRYADLRGADLDFSCLPLWCGGSRFKADVRLVRQLLAHVATIDIVDADDTLNVVTVAILPEARKSHRAADLGLLKEGE